MFSKTSPLSNWVRIFSAHLRADLNSPLWPIIFPPYPARLFLGDCTELDLPLLDGRVAELQQALCLLPGLLDGGERGADAEPGRSPVAVHSLSFTGGRRGG